MKAPKISLHLPYTTDTGKIQKERRISERLAKNEYLINISKVKKDTTAYTNLIL